MHTRTPSPSIFLCPVLFLLLLMDTRNCVVTCLSQRVETRRLPRHPCVAVTIFRYRAFEVSCVSMCCGVLHVGATGTGKARKAPVRHRTSNIETSPSSRTS
ncbi:hypothetical protein BDW22DRAFT_1349650 [Trametopsis cervina]|nr:hypothetical protein BDW22DRAFT_1349650 [Trametopsis cervina]